MLERLVFYAAIAFSIFLTVKFYSYITSSAFNIFMHIVFCGLLTFIGYVFYKLSNQPKN